MFVADEIQTGFGRTGAMFACEHEGVVPDLITTAKALAGGMPLSAVTGRAEIMDAVDPGGIGGTYAGNPVACAAALAAIDLIEREDLPARAREIEAFALARLEVLRDRYPSVGDARGRGAMLAIEFVRPGTTEPDPDAAKAVAASANSQGVLTLTCGTFGNVIRLLPPLVITDAQLDDALSVIEGAVDAMLGPMSDVSHDARTGTVVARVPHQHGRPGARRRRPGGRGGSRCRVRHARRAPALAASRSPTPSRTRGPPASWSRVADRETALGEARLTSELVRCAGQLRFYGDVGAEGVVPPA